MKLRVGWGGLSAVLAFALGAGCLGASFSSGTGGGTSTGSSSSGSSSSGSSSSGSSSSSSSGSIACACDVGATCDAGTCSCAGDLTCPGVCTQRTGPGDPTNCGTCGTVCQDTQVCTNSICQCRPLLTPCGGTCVDLENDPNNCGACGTKCGPGELCISPGVNMPGACMTASSCPPLNTACGSGSCVLTALFLGDPVHCGGCNTVCAPSEICTADGLCRKYFAPPGCTACPCAACGSGEKCCPMNNVPLCVTGDVCGF